ncbi:MAG: MBOAT family protein [Deltaproteobacteria bacterium]|nr:MBOAT family protein [Deltaproteobacteria bacterium]
MLFPTPEYAIFFLAIFAAAWAARRSARAHKGLLLGASYLFYGYWDWRFLPLLIGISLLAALAGQRIQAERRSAARKAILAAAAATCLGALGIFKYLGFGAAAFISLLELVGVHPGPVSLPEIALPVGVSFFVFHAISLMVDAYRGRIPVKVTVLDSLLYVAFFPQLVAGPILRASSFLPQLAAPPDPSSVDVARALELIVVGLVKKVLIASFLATYLVDPAFASPSEHPGLEALLAIYGYAAQIYCDFSGYTDMAIGSALLLGYRFPENFDAPYRATSPQDFWHRWHISLSSWLRDYLFVPLGGSRRGSRRTLINLALTMVLGGLWHGAAWTFVIWGAFQGAGLIVHRLWAASPSSSVKAVRSWVGWPHLARVLTFHFVCLGWVLFRAPSLEGAAELLGSLFQPWQAGPWLTAAALLAIALGILGPDFPSRARGVLRLRFSRLPLSVQGLAFALAVLAIEAAGPQGVAPFIYFQF